MWKRVKNYILPYSVGIAIPLSVGILSAYLTMGNMDIYSYIITPPLAPKAIIFPIVWSILYVLMGVSSARIFINREQSLSDAKCGLKYYAISLIFNFGWSLIFFNATAFLIAFIWLGFLFSYVLKTILSYFKADKISALLQLPYLLWIVFAGYLNFAIYLLN